MLLICVTVVHDGMERNPVFLVTEFAGTRGSCREAATNWTRFGFKPASPLPSWWEWWRLEAKVRLRTCRFDSKTTESYGNSNLPILS